MSKLMHNLKRIKIQLISIPKEALVSILVLFICSANAFPQSYRLSGTIIDKNDNQPVIGAFVYLNDLKDTTDRVATTTDVSGKFSFTGLRKKSYRLTIQSINYERNTQIIDLAKPVTEMGTVALAMESKVLKEVVVVGQGTAVQKGDTTVMTADAFKVNQDANAEDLVKKMPGITVENGTVKARGEEVKKVLVDGKPFFGDDPSVALRNLPADVIDRVQVYNKLSDQAELTGFDDGESARTINIITRKSNVYSKFGKITAGTDFTDKYLIGGNLNIFSGPRRITINGMTNNVNMANFAMQDLVGTSGSGGFRGNWGGRNFGGASGISKNSSLGFNYQDNWGKKITASGSYLFTTTSNTTLTNSNTVYISTSENGKYVTDSSRAYSDNYNHRINLRIEYNIDSLNSMIIVPRFSYQQNDADRAALSFITGGVVNSFTDNNTNSASSGYNLGNDITWRHKFMKPGRTLSVRSSVSYDKRSSNSTQRAYIDSIPDNQYSDVDNDNFTLNTNLNYTEPIGKNSQLQLNYDNRFRRGNNSNEIYALGFESEATTKLDSLSNVFDSDYITNRAGLSYLFKKDKLNFSAGVGYERADLKGDQVFPEQARVEKTFEKFLPNFMLNYKFSDISNLRLFYYTNTNAPSISDLQNAIDNSDRFRIRTGNPNLKQSYNHGIMSNYSYANPTSGFNTFIMLRGSYTNDIIANKTIRAEGDTLMQPEGIDVILMPGSQLTYPVNLDNSWSLNSMVNLSYFLKPIKSNISFLIGGGYSESPEFIQSIINTQKSYNLTNSLIITSNISQNVDFTLSYTSNFTQAKNTYNSRKDEKYWSQFASAKINLVFLKGFTFASDVVGQYNQIDQGSDQDYIEKYMVWNASLGRKFLKNNAAELRVGAYDILNQNRSYSHSVTASYTRDSWTNAYKRYFLVLFTYNLRAKNSQGVPNQQQPTNMPGMPPGVRPGGGYPGGGYPGGGYPGGGNHDH